MGSRQEARLQASFYDLFEDFNSGKAVSLLVEIVEIVAVGEALLEVVVVAECGCWVQTYDFFFGMDFFMKM